MFGLPGNFPYVECAVCGCLQIAEFPAEMAAYYPTDYYSYAASGAKGRLHRFAKGLHIRNAIGWKSPLGAILGRLFSPADSFLVEIARHIQLRTDMHIVDIGSGNGRRILDWKHVGFKKLTGIDPFVAASIDYGDGVEVRKGAITEVRLDADLVIAHHSFEHIADQDETMRAIAAMLRPGGFAVLAVPLWDSDAAREYARDWVQLDAPRHFYLHTHRSLRMLAERAGLTVSHVVHNSTPFQFWGSEQIRRGILLRSAKSYAVSPTASIFTPKMIAEFKRRSDDANAHQTGDQASFYLQKVAC